MRHFQDYLTISTSGKPIGGFTFASAHLTVVPQGILLNGSLDLGPIGKASFTSGLTQNGNFVLTATASTNFGIPLMPKATANLTLSNSGLTAATMVEFLGQQADLSGSIQPNLDFRLKGVIDVGFHFAGISPSALVAVTLANVGGNVSLGGNFDLGFSVLGASFNLVTSVFLAFAGAGIPVYSGSATVTATALGVSASGMIAVTNNALVIDLPLIPTVTIPLPF